MSLLEVNPGSCIAVVGPAVTRLCLSEIPDSVKLSHHAFIRAGTDLLGVDERGRLQELEEEGDWNSIAKELDYLLTEKKMKDQWIQTHLSLPGVHTQTTNPTLQLLFNMQRQGCKMVYTYYDNFLDTIGETQPVLLSDENLTEQWIQGQTEGFLHIHGCISNTASLVFHDSHYTSHVINQILFVKLKQLFLQRSVLFIGHDADYINPLLITMVQVLLQEEGVIKNPPIFLSSLTHSLIPDCFLHLPLSKSDKTPLHELIVISKDSSFMTGRVTDKSVDKDVARSQAVLIFSEKQSFRKLGDIIYHLNQSGEIYVRRDALTILFGSRIMYGNILTYGGTGLHRIWELILPRGSILQSKGLVAIGLHNTFLIWTNRKPIGLGSITDVKTFHSLWNNSLSAISQSKTCLSPISPSIAHSSLLPLATCGPSLLSAVLPINFLPFHPLLTVGGVSATPMATGNVSVAQTLFAAPTSSLISSEEQTSTTRTSASISTGMSPAISTGMCLKISTGMSPTGTGMSPTTSSPTKPDTIVTNSTGMNLTSDTRTSSTDSMRMSPDNTSSSTSNLSPGDPLVPRMESGILLKADPPLSMEVAHQQILSAHEVNIVVIPQDVDASTSEDTVTTSQNIIWEPVSMTMPSSARPTTLLPRPFPIGGLTQIPPLLYVPIRQQSTGSVILPLSSLTPYCLSTTSLTPYGTTPLQSLGTPLQSLGTPLQSLGTPLQSLGTPLQSLGTPLQSLGTPLQSLGTPLQSLGTPLQSLGIPLQSLGTPLQSLGTPLQSLGTPLQSLGIPLQSLGTPLQSLGIPLQSLGTPLQSLGTLLQSLGTPLQSLGTPLQSLGTPLQSLGTPLQSLGTPLQSLGTPLQSLGTPLQSLGTPLQSLGTPLQSLGTYGTCTSLQSLSRYSLPNTSLSTGCTTVPPDSSPTESSRDREAVQSYTEGAAVGGRINHLWQFLLHLLLSPNHGHIIQWTGHKYEFCITDPTRLTKMWAESSQNDSLTFHGLIGELRSYTGLDILEKVEGKELNYQFKMDIQAYLMIHAGSLSEKL